MGVAGAVGGMIMSKYAGWVLDRLGTYTPIFVVAASAYLLAAAAFLLPFGRLADIIGGHGGKAEDPLIGGRFGVRTLV